jgi:hypothetical protein
MPTRRNPPALALALFALALLAAGPLARAADADGRFAVKGAGVTRCAAFVEAREKQRDTAIASYVNWMYGYITATNRSSPETFDLIAWEGAGVLLAALDAHCRKNPDLPFHVAIGALVNTLARDRIAARSELVRVTSGETTLIFYEETLRRMQKQLADRKFYNGKIDGRFGDGTRRALEAFQKSENIAVTGLPDQLTLLRLVRPAAAAETPPAARTPAPAPASSPRPRPAR